MNKKIDEAYLRRTLQRRVDEAGLEASNAALAIFRKANAAGLLNSGNTLISINETLLALYVRRIESMAQFLFNVIGKVDDNAADLLSEYGEKLSEVIGAAINSMYSTSLARGLVGINLKMTKELQDRLRDQRARVVDDYQHSMLGDATLTKDPFVSVTSTIVNSPGAIQQSGAGSLHQSVVQNEIAPFIAALNYFLLSEEVERLDTEHKEALSDVADVLRAEVQASQPDVSKIKRWSDRLLGLASDFGVQTSAATLATILAKMLGY